MKKGAECSWGAGGVANTMQSGAELGIGDGGGALSQQPSRQEGHHKRMLANARLVQDSMQVRGPFCVRMQMQDWCKALDASAGLPSGS